MALSFGHLDAKNPQVCEPAGGKSLLEGTELENDAHSVWVFAVKRQVLLAQGGMLFGMTETEQICPLHEISTKHRVAFEEIPRTQNRCR